MPGRCRAGRHRQRSGIRRGRRTASRSPSPKTPARGFAIVVLGARRRRRQTKISGDGEARWPAWTRDGRVVFSRRQAGPLAAVRGHRSTADRRQPLFPDAGGDDRARSRASRPTASGSRSSRIARRDDGDIDLWVADLRPAAARAVRRTRVAQDPRRRSVPVVGAGRIAPGLLRGARGRAGVWVDGGRSGDARPTGEAPDPGLAARRHAGVVARRPADCDRRSAAGRTRLQRQPAAQPATSRRRCSPTRFRLWIVDAPLPVDSGARDDRARRRRRPAGSPRRSIACGKRCAGSITRTGRRARSGQR